MTLSEAKDDTFLQLSTPESAQEIYSPTVPFIANIRLSTGMIKQSCLELSSNLQGPFRSRNNLAYVFSSEDVN
jgi:hypothetical protein